MIYVDKQKVFSVVGAVLSTFGKFLFAGFVSFFIAYSMAATAAAILHANLSMYLLWNMPELLRAVVAIATLCGWIALTTLEIKNKLK